MLIIVRNCAYYSNRWPGAAPAAGGSGREITHRLPAVDAPPGELSGRRWVLAPQSPSCAAAPSRSLPNMTSRAPVIPACAGRLSGRGQVAGQSSPWRSGPSHDPGRAGPSLVGGLLVFVVLSRLCPSWLLPARRPDCGQLPVPTGTNQAGARTLKSRPGRDANLIPCAPQGASARHRRSMPCPARTGATFKCSRRAHGAGGGMREGLDALSGRACAGTTRAAPPSALGEPMPVRG
jgi:hypothetical protein